MEYSEKAEANCTTQLKTPAQIKSAGGPDFTDDMSDYNFLGWSRDPFATYPEFCGAGLPNNANFDRNIKLNGVWELKWCWVTFNLMGGSGTSYSIQIPKGGKISNFPETTKNGYIFLGWSTSPDGGISVTGETVVTNDLILFAQWQMDYSILI